GAGTGLELLSNTLVSNDVSLNIGDNDSWQQTNQGILMVGNTISKSSDGAVRPYTSILAGGSQNSVSNISLIDTKYANGAMPGITFTGAVAKDMETGWLLGVGVTTQAGAVLSGAVVQVIDAKGNVVYSGTTDASGTVANIPVVTTTYRQ